MLLLSKRMSRMTHLLSLLCILLALLLASLELAVGTLKHALQFLGFPAHEQVRNFDQSRCSPLADHLAGHFILVEVLRRATCSIGFRCFCHGSRHRRRGIRCLRGHLAAGCRSRLQQCRVVNESSRRALWEPRGSGDVHERLLDEASQHTMARVLSWQSS